VVTSRKRKISNEPIGLTRDIVRREALRLIDKGGLEEFSTRKLGRALGCEAMAIYWYYPSKDALLDDVVDLLVSRIGESLVAAETTDWVDAFRRVARAYRAIAHKHPKAFPLLATRRFATPGAYAFLEQLFTLTHDQGIPDRTTARFFRAVSGYCSGVALDELGGAREGSDPALAAVRRRFTRVTAVWNWLGKGHEDDLFEFGLNILLDALVHAGRPRRK
jgi:AcrR family transcriptional regulator